MSSSEYIPYDQSTPPHQNEWRSSLERFSVLTPEEIVAATRLAVADPMETKGRRVGDLFEDDLTNYLSVVTENDIDRAIEVVDAFASSPIPQDRYYATLVMPGEITKQNHEVGLSFFHRLIGDPDREVRYWSEQFIGDQLENCVNGEYDKARHGMRVVDELDETELLNNTGLTRQDVCDLYETYAYAENGLYHDVALGRAALAKLAAVEPPSAPESI